MTDAKTHAAGVAEMRKISTVYAHDLGSVLVEGEVGYAPMVRVTVNKGEWVRIELCMEPDQARELGVHLMNAALAAERK